MLVLSHTPQPKVSALLNRWLLLVPFNLFINQPALATITNIQIGNASNVDTTTSPLTVYGGFVGDTTSCSSGQSTCNTCIQTSRGSYADAPLACNKATILPASNLSITFTSTIQGLAYITDSTGLKTPNGYTAVQAYANSPVTITANWGAVCDLAASGQTITPTPTSGKCDSNFTGNFYIGVDGTGSGGLSGGSGSTTTTTLSGSTGGSVDKVALNVRIQGKMCDAIDTDGSLVTTPPNCASSSDTTGGLWSFVAFPGDSKAYMTQVQATTAGFPTLSSGILADKILYFYREISATAGACGNISQLLNSSTYFETGFTDTSSNLVPDTSRFPGLTNGHHYLFKIAIKDKAGNIGLFTPDTKCACDAVSEPGCTPAVNAKYGNHVITPSEVSGVLANQKNCFIATAAFGSPLEPHVNTFRHFRDQFLLKNKMGLKLTAFYYRHSPEWAEAISKNIWAQRVTRAILWPLWYLSAIAVGEQSPIFLWLGLFAICAILLFAKLKNRNFKTTRNDSAARITKAIFVIFVFSKMTFVAAKAYAQDTPPQEPPYVEAPEEGFTAENNSKKDSPNDKPSETEETVTFAPQETLGNSGDKNPLRKDLLRITKKGEFIYRTEPTPMSHSASLKVGTFSSPNISNPNTGATFSQIYGDNKAIMYFDYGWLLTRAVGRLFLKAGSGLFTASGAGRFANGPLQGSKAMELYTFFLLPNTASVEYRLQFKDRQIFVPHGEAGVDYLVFAENRDDNVGLKYGGAPGFHFNVGLSIALNSLSDFDSFTLDRDYGITGVYFTLEYRFMAAANSLMNINQSLIDGGLTFDF